MRYRFQLEQFIIYVCMEVWYQAFRHIKPFFYCNIIILFKIIKTNTQYQRRIHLDFVADDFVVIFMSNTHS